MLCLGRCNLIKQVTDESFPLKGNESTLEHQQDPDREKKATANNNLAQTGQRLSRPMITECSVFCYIFEFYLCVSLIPLAYLV